MTGTFPLNRQPNGSIKANKTQTDNVTRNAELNAAVHHRLTECMEFLKYAGAEWMDLKKEHKAAAGRIFDRED